MPIKSNALIACLCLFGFLGCASQKPMFSSSFQNQPPRHLAVLPFESSNPYIPGSSLSDSFTIQILQNMAGVEVIERKDLIKVLQEQKLSMSGVMKPEKISKLGSILGVEMVVFGSVQTLEAINNVSGAVSVTIKLVDVSSGRVLWADKQKISHATWSAREIEDVAETIMEKAAQKMVERMEKNSALWRSPAAAEWAKAAVKPYEMSLAYSKD